MPAKNENELYVDILCNHIANMSYRLRQIPEDKWDWQPEIYVPTARTLAVHMLQWLQCDRQHINELDASKHVPVYEPTSDIISICDEIDAENKRWKELLLSLTPDQLDEPRYQFNGTDYPMNVRDFVGHMVQNSIYKHGQLSYIYFWLGLDGVGPYEAPFPNPIYEEIFGTKSIV